MASDNAIDNVRARIRADLRAAMSARKTAEVAVLRTLLAAFDNAEAVSVTPERYTVRSFGDPATEVSRKHLSAEDVAKILEAEEREKLTVAASLKMAGRTEDAAKLESEAAILARYRPQE